MLKKWQKVMWDGLNPVLKKRPNQPQHIAGPSSSQYWTIIKAITEFITNLIDQAKVTASKKFPGDTPRVLHWRSRSKKEIRIVFYPEGTSWKLAEIVYKKKETQYHENYVERSTERSTKYEALRVHKAVSTWELSLVNYASYIPPSAFLRGVSGQEKRGNVLCIGKFGDGLTSGIDTVCRRGINIAVATAGYTARGIPKNDGHCFVQFEKNNKAETKVEITLTFMPKAYPFDSRYATEYTDHARDPHDPETFDPMSIFLPDSADRVLVNANDPEGDPSAILLGDDMRGKYFNRGVPVCDNEDSALFGYNFGDSNLIQGRDRSSMKRNMTDAAIVKMICRGIERSPRFRRMLVLALTRGREWNTSSLEDMRVAKWGAVAWKRIRQEHRIMFPGTVLVRDIPDDSEKLIAELRDLKVISCHPQLDEGNTLAYDFAKELRSLPREEIGASASGWASTVREKLLQLTGATELASVDVPGKLGAEHIVWVEKGVVLVSRRSLEVDLKQEDYKVIRHILPLITTSFELHKIPANPAEVFTLIITAEHRLEPSSAAVVDGSRDPPNGAMPGSEAGLQGLSAGDGESAGDASRVAVETEDASSSAVVDGSPGASNGVAAGSAAGVQRLQGVGEEGPGDSSQRAVEAEDASPLAVASVAPNRVAAGRDGGAEGLPESGEEKEGEAGDAAPSMVVVSRAPDVPNGATPGHGGAQGLQESGEENAGGALRGAVETALAIEEEEANPGSAESGGGVDEAVADEGGDESDGVGMEEDESAGDVGESSLCGEKRKRTSDAVSAEGTARGRETGARLKQEASGSGGGGSGATSAVAEKAAGLPSVAVKVEEQRSPQRGASSAPLRLNAAGVTETSEVALAQPPGSEQPALEEPGGLDPGVGEEERAEAPPLAQAAAGAAPIGLPARDGEELAAFLSQGGGDLVPALIHVGRHAWRGGANATGRSVDRYRIAGRVDNEAKLSARFSAVLASERARMVIESAVRKPGVDLSFIFWDEAGALPAFVGEGGRIFVNLHDPSSQSVDEWAADDLPIHIATHVAHVRSGASGIVRSHAWSVEFRRFVLSEERQT